MSLLGFGNTKSTTNLTTNNISPTAGAQSGNAPAAGVVAEGDVNITQQITDAGVNRLLENIGTDVVRVAGEAIAANEGVTDEALFFARDSQRIGDDLVRDVIDAAGRFAGDVVTGASAFGSDALFTAEQARKDSLDFGRDTLYESLHFGRDALDQAAKAFSAAEEARRDAFGFGRDSLNLAADVVQDQRYTTQSVIDLADDLTVNNQEFLSKALFDVVSTVKDLDESRSRESTKSIEAISTLGQVVSTGGESLQIEMQKLATLAVVIVLGVVAWQAVRR